MNARLLLAGALLVALASARDARSQTGSTARDSTAPTISDNSFLVEEAYNQEARVVQHISNFRRARDGSWLGTFTQEWPAPSQRHQLSYTAALLSASGVGTGLGDLIINYRFQAIGRDEDRVWFAPRLSVILPTGDVRSGRGNGGPGVQVNLPVSVQLSEHVVTHWNAGATTTRARNAAGLRREADAVNAAASVIWLVSSRFNVMLETAWDRTQTLDDIGSRISAEHFVVLPGFRGAINLPSGMQIVPGIGIPIGVGPSRGERDLFLYLSVEHGF